MITVLVKTVNVVRSNLLHSDGHPVVRCCFTFEYVDLLMLSYFLMLISLRYKFRGTVGCSSTRDL